MSRSIILPLLPLFLAACGAVPEVPMDAAPDDLLMPDLCEPRTYYVDGDRDGYGMNTMSVVACTKPIGYVEKKGDCDDKSAAVNPDAPEQCNRLDDDCDGAVDEGLPLNVYFVDADADGWGGTGIVQACGPPPGFVDRPGDCADDKPAINPGVMDACNEIDDNCNGMTDEGFAKAQFFLDKDGDGYGTTPTDFLCKAPQGYADKNGDCEDGDPSIHPGAAELCDNIDQNCNGAVKDGLPQIAYFTDGDKDGFGKTFCGLDCRAPIGCVDNADDCDDTDSGIHPGVKEICNHLDDDCRGGPDDGLPKIAYYQDDDADGYGTVYVGDDCAPKRGAAPKNGDCADNNPAINPGAMETCNEYDDNCDGRTDEGFTKRFYFQDLDGDGWGFATIGPLCAPPLGFTDKGGDCVDNNVNIHPTAMEQCNGEDDDCNGIKDDNEQLQISYQDIDGDGWARLGAASQSKCNIPAGWVPARDLNGDGTPDWDCDDGDLTIYPGAPEKCGDNKDNDCDGTIDRLCFTSCTGAWAQAPFRLQSSLATRSLSAVDLNGDGDHEVLVQDDFGFAVLDAQGKPLYQYSAPVYNYSRAMAVVADIDDYDAFGAAQQTLEVLTGNGSVPRYYKVDALGNVTVFAGVDRVYDASSFAARDLDGDGTVEFLTGSWCEGARGTMAFRFDRAMSRINLAGVVADPQNVCEYWGSRMLTDLDGDGRLEFVFSNGYPDNTTPNTWGGHIYARAFTNLKTFTSVDFCVGCFLTDVMGRYGGYVPPLMRVGDEIRADVTYYLSNQPGVANASESKYWAFDLAGKVRVGPASQSALFAGTTDVDRNGVADDFGAYQVYSASTGNRNFGLFDVNGDGYPDRIYGFGGELRLDLWNPQRKQFEESTVSRLYVSPKGMTARAAWDIDGDGRIEVLSSDGNANVYCHRLGVKTWSREGALPPRFPIYSRTYQWDNEEPNEGTDNNLDGVPDGWVQIPSALTSSGDFYSHLSSVADKDYYLVATGWGGAVCLQPPKGATYKFRVFSDADRWNNLDHTLGPDGKPDGLVWEGVTSPGVELCTTADAKHKGLFKFIVGVEPANNSANAFWPYWITTPPS